MNPIAQSTHAGEHLSTLLSGLVAVDENHDPLIEAIHLDSRDVRPGSLFFAVPGFQDDGRAYIPSAIAAGARAVVFEAKGWHTDQQSRVPQIGVSDLTSKISKIADVFFKQPSLKLHVVGITGTNGKSSCAALTAQALESLGHSCGIVGTLGCGFPGRLSPLPLTTPNSISLQRHLASLADSGAQYLCLEVSSHSLDQSRTDGVRFGTVVLTNLTWDHLDYHESEANYRAAKSKLFRQSAVASHAVLNVDDDFGRSLHGKTVAQREITYGKRASDVRLIKHAADRSGITVSLDIQGRQVEARSDLLGRFNAMNLTTVAAILYSLGCRPAQIGTALNSLKPVAGRMEKIQGSLQKPSVYVDYAHTPDALKQALDSLQEITTGEVWCVFGCGGERDSGKRPLMGEIAESIADQVIVTDDNPRAEQPQTIVRQITEGMKSAPVVIHDRKEAIHFAIRRARADDAVLIAGKGHETVQLYGKDSFLFSDRTVAEEALRGSEC